MKFLFKFLFSIGLLAALAFVTYKFLVNSDSQLGNQLQEIVETFQSSDNRTETVLPQSQLENVERSEESKRQIEQPVESTQQQDRQQMTLYRWKDENGRTQITDQPPEGRDYKTISYQDPKNLPKTAPRTNLKPNFSSTPSQPLQPESQQSVKSTPLPVHCQVKMRAVHRLEKKLDKADDIVNSIWLQDYCTALSELIQDSCIVPKSEVKYNKYCPVRFKR